MRIHHQRFERTAEPEGLGDESGHLGRIVGDGPRLAGEAGERGHVTVSVGEHRPPGGGRVAGEADRHPLLQRPARPGFESLGHARADELRGAAARELHDEIPANEHPEHLAVDGEPVVVPDPAAADTRLPQVARRELGEQLGRPAAVIAVRHAPDATTLAGGPTD